MNLIRSFLDNDSVFGKLMTRCGILIGANLMFILFCIPVVTIGTSCSALYYTMMKTLRGEDELNPFATFWKAFRENWKQTVPIWLALLILAAFLRLELFWCSQFTGLVAMFSSSLMLKQFTPFLPAEETSGHKDFHGDEVFYDDAFL